jgi:hypothetical protein
MKIHTHKIILIVFITWSYFAQAGDIAADMKNPKYRDPVELEKFVLAIKTLKIGEDTPDVIIKKIGEPSLKNNYEGVQTWCYPLYIIDGKGINTSLYIGREGKLVKVEISKNGTGQIYRVGDLEISSAASPTSGSNASNVTADYMKQSAAEPVTPKPGQIYFNSTDSHFYGWNGKEWKQLDK